MASPERSAAWRFFQRPQRADDPIRPVWFRIHRDHQYEPSNVEARFLCERLKEVEVERNFFEGALREIRELTVEVGDSVEAATRASHIAMEALPDGD